MTFFHKIKTQIIKNNDLPELEHSFVKNEILVPMFGLGGIVALLLNWLQTNLGINDLFDSFLINCFAYFLFFEVLLCLFFKKFLIKQINYAIGFFAFLFWLRLGNGFFGNDLYKQHILVSMSCFIPLTYLVIFLFVKKYSFKFAITFYLATLIECIFAPHIWNLNHTYITEKQTVFALVFMQPILIFGCTYFAHLRKIAIKSSYNENTDLLTQIPNRRSIDFVLNKAEKNHTQFAVSLIDIDNFKKINDTYGHLVGDEVLKLVAQTIKQSLRNEDIIARWGGEEFMLLINTTNIDDALEINNRICENISNIKHGLVPQVTASIGLAINSKFSNKELIDFADKALYLAKNTGKNKVVIDKISY